MDQFKFAARANFRNAVFCLLATLGLAACGAGDSSTGAASTTGAAASGTTQPVTSAPGGSTPGTSTVTPVVTPPVVASTPPTISGKSVNTVTVGTAYSFKPTVAASAGTTLTFSIQNKPEWAMFNTASGTLSGTPTAANVGTYSNIIVTVSDGTSSAALPAYTLTVSHSANGTATVDWTPPTENSDGTALSNLAGYKVYYGTSASNLTQVAQVTNPGLASYTVSNLSSGTWYFAVAAYTNTGVEGSPSGVVSTTL